MEKLQNIVVLGLGLGLEAPRNHFVGRFGFRLQSTPLCFPLVPYVELMIRKPIRCIVIWSDPTRMRAYRNS